MNSLGNTQVFNRADRIVAGWYWALRAIELKQGQACAINFLGRELVVFRGTGGKVTALDAFCPHMGAHLAEGKVEGDDIRCLFHYWKFNAQGNCVEIPCQKSTAGVPPIQTWAVTEAYGLIWIWAGAQTPTVLPQVPELDASAFAFGKSFVKSCHPNVMMINAIDAQHFNSVHNLPVTLQLKPHFVSESCIQFRNTTAMPRHSMLTRFLSRFYRAALTYELCYWFGSTGTVTLGPDFLHFYIMFALRPTQDGRSEGQTILFTKQRNGLLGHLTNHILLVMTRLVAAYFAQGDTLIFKTIRFNFRTPIKADLPIIRFIQHVEQQPTLAWGLVLEEATEFAPQLEIVEVTQ
jgi:phenylpropionate dioxygenase-like ring-hydroxylating dioxygenase large terminal subunit